MCKRKNKDILSSELPSTLVIWSSADKVMWITAPTFQLRSIVIVSSFIYLFHSRPFSTIRRNMQLPCSVQQVLTVCTHLWRTGRILQERVKTTILCKLYPVRHVSTSKESKQKFWRPLTAARTLAPVFLRQGPLEVGNCREYMDISLICFVLSVLINRNEHSAHCVAGKPYSLQLWMVMHLLTDVL